MINQFIRNQNDLKQKRKNTTGKENTERIYRGSAIAAYVLFEKQGYDSFINAENKAQAFSEKTRNNMYIEFKSSRTFYTSLEAPRNLLQKLAKRSGFVAANPRIFPLLLTNCN